MKTSKTNRTPRASGKSFVASFPSSKKKPKPNGSILSYFKKSADETLFIGDVQTELAVEDHQEDIHGLEEPSEPRYNEIEASVKKRKITPPIDDPSTTPEQKTSPALPRKQPKKIFNNPFLDDSSDEDEPVPQGQCAEQPEDKMVVDGESFQDRDLEHDIDGPGTKTTSGSAVTCDPPMQTEENGTNSDDIEPPSKDDNEPSVDGDFGEFEDLDMEDFADDEPIHGEEFREMRYMEEQARLEAEEEASYSCDDGLPQQSVDDSMTEKCPICDGSLAGITADEATAHVNGCLDGKPTSLPTPSRPAKFDRKIEVEAPELSKRFARAAVPRPGQANPIHLGDDSRSGKGSSVSAFAKLMSGHAEDTAWAVAAAAEHTSRGKPAYKRTCPFYKIMPGFFICVDAFRYGAVDGCKAYFLSHFHSDHYIGLTANWTHGPIYCSKVTGSLVKSQLRTAANFVVELEFEETTPVPGIDGVTVTMIPANHCPGSSLFLFEKVIGSRTQRILHCGDFRACPAHVTHAQLRPETIDAITGKTRQQKIDVCYLDTTYLNPRYSFPPQEDVTQACADLCLSLDEALASGNDDVWDKLLRRRQGVAAGTDSVSKFFTTEKSDAPSTTTNPKDPADDVIPSSAETLSTPRNAFAAITRQPKPPIRPRLLVICGTYSIGKERICTAIAHALQTKIYAPPSKKRVLTQLDDPELTALLTSKPAEAQVHMQMLTEIRAETLSEYLESYRPHFARIVGFRPSGWNYRPPGSVNASANLAPSSLATSQLLHGNGWRPRLAARDLVPQRGCTREAACFGVPYSEHSSFRELAMFLMALRIEKVVPTVNVGSEQSRRRMKGWTDRWLAERRRGGLVRVVDEGAMMDGEEIAMWDGKDGKGGSVYW